MEKNFLVEANVKGKSGFISIENLINNSTGHVHILTLHSYCRGKGNGKRFTWNATFWVDMVGFMIITKALFIEVIKLRVCSDLKQSELQTFDEIQKFIFDYYHNNPIAVSED